MAKTKLYLKQPKSIKATPIVLSFSFDGKRVRLGTGETIEPPHWNEKTQQVRASYTGSVEINANLDKRIALIKEIYHRAKFENYNPTAEFVKDEYNRATSPDKAADDFWAHVDQYIEMSKTSATPKYRKSKSTITVYKSTVKHLKAFEKKRRTKITLPSIDKYFRDEFNDYLMHTLQMSNNTVGKYVKTLKTFLNYIANETNDHELAFRVKKFEVIQEETDAIYLTEDEIQTMYDLDLSHNSRLEKVRDIFVFQCYIGLRVSDLLRLNSNHIKDDLIQIKTIKTGKKVVIPIHPKARAILEKYDGMLPSGISDQKYNAYIKEVAQLAGLDEPIHQEKTKGGKKYTETSPKYQLIASHTARRSFATNAYNSMFKFFHTCILFSVPFCWVKGAIGVKKLRIR